MKFGIRKPAFKKRLSAKTSFKRAVRHNMGIKAPRGGGWITNPKKAAYNKVYNKTSTGCIGSGCGCLIYMFATLAIFSLIVLAFLV